MIFIIIKILNKLLFYEKKKKITHTHTHTVTDREMRETDKKK